MIGRRGGPEFVDSELARLGHLVGLASRSPARPGPDSAERTDLIRVTKIEPRIATRKAPEVEHAVADREPVAVGLGHAAGPSTTSRITAARPGDDLRQRVGDVDDAEVLGPVLGPRQHLGDQREVDRGVDAVAQPISTAATTAVGQVCPTAEQQRRERRRRRRTRSRTPCAGRCGRSRCRRSRRSAAGRRRRSRSAGRPGPRPRPAEAEHVLQVVEEVEQPERVAEVDQEAGQPGPGEVGVLARRDPERRAGTHPSRTAPGAPRAPARGRGTRSSTAPPARAARPR